MHTQSTRLQPLMNLLFVLAAAAMLTLVSACKEEPTATERVENAADEMTDGVEDAAEEMQDRSATEKMGDAVEDAGEEIKENAE